MSNRERKLTLFALTWPILIELFLHMVMGNADTLMLSQYSDQSVASVGVANRIVYIIILIYGVIATGTAVLVANHLGAKDQQKASEVAAVSIVGNLLVGILFSLIIMLFGRQLLIAMGLPQELLQEAEVYIVIVGGFSFLQAVILTISAVLRSHGSTKDVMFVTIGMNVLDLIGNYLFIFGPFGIPVLGVFGVAITTTCTRAIGLLVVFVLLQRRMKSPLPFMRVARLPLEHSKNLLRIGIPSALELLSYHTSQLAITFIVTFMGSQALVAKVYTENIMMFIYLFSMAVSQGTQILIGHIAGARHFQQAYERCMRSVKMAFGISFVAATIMYMFSNQLFGLFTDDQQIIQVGSILIMSTIALEPGRSLNLVILGALRVVGDIRFAVYLGIVSMWGISVGMSYFLGVYLGFGLIGIWIAFVLDEWVRGLILLKRWTSKAWMKKTALQGVS